jgi:hypothetical protein
LRFIDLAVAALIGSSAITGIVALNPQAGDAGAGQAALQARLRDSLLEFLQRSGMTQFVQSPAAACQRLAEASNSTIKFYSTVGSASCGIPPGSGSQSATLSFRLVPFEVVLVAWSSD